MPTFYVKSGSGAAEFQTSHAYSLGDRMVIKRSDTGTAYQYARSWVFECTTAGTSAGTNPTWSPAIYSCSQDTGTITSGGAVFTPRRPGYSSGTTVNWTFATIYLDYIFGGWAEWGGSVDRVFVSNNHSENIAATVTFDPGTYSCPILCVNDSATPPTALATGALLAANGIILDHFFYAYGIEFRANTGSINSSTSSTFTLDHCLLNLNHATGSARILICQSLNYNILNNTEAKFGHASQGFSFSNSSGGSYLKWSGGGLNSGSAATTTLLNGVEGTVHLEDLDLSVGASAMVLANSFGSWGSSFRVINCKLPASWSGTMPIALISSGTFISELVYSDSANTNYRRYASVRDGALNTETTIVRTGGASDGVTPISWKLVSTAACEYLVETAKFEIAQWNSIVGSSQTITVHFVHDTNVVAGQGGGAEQESERSNRASHPPSPSEPGADRLHP